MSWTEKVAVFDTETTGVDPTEARLVTAFVGMLDAGGDMERGTDWLADPGVEIPEQAAAVHGITTEMARAEGEPIAEVLEKVVASLNWIAKHGLALVIYNAPFDLTLIDAECRRYGVTPPQLGKQVVDPLVIDRAVDRYRKGKRTLTDTAAVYGVDLLDAHDAAADAIAAGHIAQAIARKYPAEVDIPLADLHAKQIEWSRASAEDFEAYMRRTKDPNFSADGRWPVRA
ncbi:exonuclease domain-containing protein [Gulosibacter molinativorax]|uniref:exonuclease domain-containing protein n=1 Tax=Gulosibacter molinativorax TaxID=256821 RepID=UPI0003F8A274|nr:exonuclease domain-containing protein [Gulosibacter molinativorax]QUY61501.1 Putative DNA polymerase III, epsilon subunit [Gulosibacter molinativorax]